VNKNELDRRTSNQIDLPIHKVREITTEFLRQIIKGLLERGVGGIVQLDDFGTLHISRRVGLLNDNPVVKYYVNLRRAEALTRALRAKFGKTQKEIRHSRAVRQRAMKRTEK
jgi:nucleoid DNA-binding protein